VFPGKDIKKKEFQHYHLMSESSILINVSCYSFTKVGIISE